MLPKLRKPIGILKQSLQPARAARKRLDALVDYLMAAGDQVRARGYLEKLLAVDSGNPAALRLRERLPPGAAPAPRSRPGGVLSALHHRPGVVFHAPFPTHIATRGHGARAYTRSSLTSCPVSN